MTILSTAAFIIQELEEAHISFVECLTVILTNPSMQTSTTARQLISDIPEVLDLFKLNKNTDNATRTWMMEGASSVFLKEVQSLTRSEAGYHFTAEKSSVEKIQECDIEHLGANMEKYAPSIWTLLLD